MMRELLISIAPELLSLAVVVVLGLLGWATHSADQRMKTGGAKDATLELIECARVVVRYLEQTMRPKIEAVSVGGKLTPEGAQELRDAALLALKDQVSDQAQKIIVNNGTRLEEAMIRAIESAVAENKQAKTLARSIRPPAINIENVGLAT